MRQRERKALLNMFLNFQISDKLEDTQSPETNLQKFSTPYVLHTFLFRFVKNAKEGSDV